MLLLGCCSQVRLNRLVVCSVLLTSKGEQTPDLQPAGRIASRIGQPGPNPRAGQSFAAFSDRRICCMFKPPPHKLQHSALILLWFQQPCLRSWLRTGPSPDQSGPEDVVGLEPLQQGQGLQGRHSCSDLDIWSVLRHRPNRFG